MKDRITEKPRGFGFVTFKEQEAADRAFQDEHVLDGRTVRTPACHSTAVLLRTTQVGRAEHSKLAIVSTAVTEEMMMFLLLPLRRQDVKRSSCSRLSWLSRPAPIRPLPAAALTALPGKESACLGTHALQGNWRSVTRSRSSSRLDAIPDTPSPHGSRVPCLHCAAVPQIDAKPSLPHGEHSSPKSKKIFVGGLAPETTEGEC